MNQKLDAHGRRHLRRMPGRQEFSGFRFDAEGHDRVAILVGGEQESAGGIDPETARSFSPGRFMADACESSGTLIDPVDHDAVVTPVRTVDKRPRRRDLDIGAGARSAVTLRECGKDMQHSERSFPAVIRQARQCGVELVDEKRKSAAGVESYVAWTGPRLHLDPGDFIRLQHPPLRVERIGHQFVQSEIGNEREPAGIIERDRVCMWALLAGGIDA